MLPSPDPSGLLSRDSTPFAFLCVLSRSIPFVCIGVHSWFLLLVRDLTCRVSFGRSTYLRIPLPRTYALSAPVPARKHLYRIFTGPLPISEVRHLVASSEMRYVPPVCHFCAIFRGCLTLNSQPFTLNCRQHLARTFTSSLPIFGLSTLVTRLSTIVGAGSACLPASLPTFTNLTI
jgi:hypothetical protein